MCVLPCPSTYLSVSMPLDRRHGKCPCPNWILVYQICMVKSVKVINELCFRVRGMLSLTSRLSLNCHRVGLFSLMAETDKPQTSQAHWLSLHAVPSSSGAETAQTCIMLTITLLLAFIWGEPAISLSPSCELWDCMRSWPQPLPTWREMCRTNASTNYTEIGHTSWISKSRALVKVSAAT